METKYDLLRVEREKLRLEMVDFNNKVHILREKIRDIDLQIDGEKYNHLNTFIGKCFHNHSTSSYFKIESINSDENFEGRQVTTFKYEDISKRFCSVNSESFYSEYELNDLIEISPERFDKILKLVLQKLS